MADFLQVQTTTSSRAEAERISDAVIEKKLAACVQIVGPITSRYRWEGKVNRDEELLLIVKTRRSLFSGLQKRVAELHSYEVPEIIAIDIDRGSRAYLGFLNKNLKAG